jgi:hypothetical protein
MSMRKDCALSKLNEEQQADLFDWLSVNTYEAVLKQIAHPPPDGFGVKTHINSLHRFYAQRQAQIRARDLANLIASGQGDASPSQPSASNHRREGEAPDEPPTQSAALDANSFFNASQIAYAHSTYLLAHSPPTPATYRYLSRALHQRDDNTIKREYLEVARQQLALARERLHFEKTQFEYNAARAAIALLPELVAIDQISTIDDEAKIWRVRERLFGSAPSPLRERAGVRGPHSNPRLPSLNFRQILRCLPFNPPPI